MVGFLVNLFMLLVIVAACAAVVAIGIVQVRRRRNLIRGGIPVVATVVGVRPISIDSSFAFEPTVRYQLHGRSWDSVPVDGRQALRTGTVIDSNRSGEQFIGTSLQVIVDPQDSRISAVRTSARLGITLIVAGSLLGGLVLLFAGLGLLISLVR